MRARSSIASVSWIAYGRDASTRCWAFTMRDDAMSSIARVIFFVDWTDRIRRRTTRSWAPIYAGRRPVAALAFFVVDRGHAIPAHVRLHLVGRGGSPKRRLRPAARRVGAKTSWNAAMAPFSVSSRLLGKVPACRGSP